MANQEEIIEELERFKLFAEFSSHGLGIGTLDTNIVYMNPALKNLLEGEHAPRDAGVNESFTKYYPPERLAVLNTIVPIVLEKGFWKGELSLKRCDGTIFPTLETFFLIKDQQGNPLYLGDIIVDITEEKTILNELALAKAEAEKANQAKSLFLANMTHEIRTPLNAILGYSQLLTQNKSLEAEPTRQLQIIEKSAKRLLDVVNDLLDLSKIEAGKLTLNNEVFDLSRELYDVCHMIENKAHVKNLHFNYDIQLNPQESVYADRTKLSQVIVNVLSNAVKFTQEGSVALLVKRQQNQIIISIKDTGPGMQQDELNSVFNPFTQGHAGKKYGGTGLGLSLSKKIIDAMQGQFEIQSHHGQGTTVNIQLNLPPSHQQQTHIMQDANIKLATSLHALVVEDDENSRMLLTIYLESLGAQVSIAENGKQALDYLQQHQPDVILTDIRMPILDGTALLAEVRKMPALVNVPVFAVTASSMVHERKFFLNQGFDEFIAKPVDFKEIVNALDKHLKLAWQNTNITANAPPQNQTGIELSAITPTLKKQLLAIAEQADMGDIAAVQSLLENTSFNAQTKPIQQAIELKLKEYDLFSLVLDIRAWLA